MTARRHAILLGLATLLWLAGGAVLLALASCTYGATAGSKATPINVRIVKMPPRPSCYIAPAPDAPELLQIDFERADVVDRAFVHVLQFQPLQTWAQDMGHWVSSVEQCLEKLQGAE